MSTPARDRLRDVCQLFGRALYRAASNQLHLLVEDRQQLLRLAQRLREEQFYLATVLANDERELEDRCFKLYYLFSHPEEDLFLVIENPLGAGSETFASLYDIFAAVEPFEREIADLYGLFPDHNPDRVPRHTYLHGCYPANFYPLRRDSQTRQLVQDFLGGTLSTVSSSPTAAHRRPPDGELFIPVGPVHAGVIEPGHFLFRVSGETIEEIDIQLGYTHKGIERLFQTSQTLADGWRLAEHVAGDSSFAHSLAYCQAAEALAQARVPDEGLLLRGIFLELERIANHVGNTARLAQDVAIELVGSELGVLREEVLRLHQRQANHRLLRGLNRPGGLILPRPLDARDIRDTISRVTTRYDRLARVLMERTDFRDRVIDVGVLARDKAATIGVSGLAARASGISRDFRVQHPTGSYKDQKALEVLHDQPDSAAASVRQGAVGDVFSRFLVRAGEVHSSATLVAHFLDLWESEGQSNRTDFTRPIDFSTALNFEFGIGYVEGWRGDIIYWLMKDKFERIYRCQVRDPSMLNWPALKIAVEPRRNGEQWLATLIADFPIINVSFDLSYSGHDR